jgi:hypothetical protein
MAQAGNHIFTVEASRLDSSQQAHRDRDDHRADDRGEDGYHVHRLRPWVPAFAGTRTLAPQGKATDEFATTPEGEAFADPVVNLQALRVRIGHTHKARAVSIRAGGQDRR